LANLGSVLEESKQLSEARGYFEQALDLDKELGDPEAVAIDLRRLGGIAELQNRLEEATGYYERAYASYVALKMAPKAAEMLKRLSRLAKANGSDDLAAHYDAALKALLP
jgi:Tfp pilus assembly protein PilF